MAGYILSSGQATLTKGAILNDSGKSSHNSFTFTVQDTLDIYLVLHSIYICKALQNRLAG